MFALFQTWRKRRALKRLVRQMGALLQQRYGFQEFYTSDQVLKTTEVIGLDQEGQSYAIAMYVQPADAIRILTTLRNAKWANDLRAIMIGDCFGFSGGNDGSSDYNVFMHHDAVLSHHAINFDGGPFDGSHGHHSSDSGHSHGGDSGGHSGSDSSGGH
jgi:uncharacterized protein DUF6559